MTSYRPEFIPGERIITGGWITGGIHGRLEWRIGLRLWMVLLDNGKEIEVEESFLRHEVEVAR